jgi:hypothetical protein
MALAGWAALQGVSPATARRWTDRAVDPLPSIRMSQRLRLIPVVAAEDWLARQDRRQQVDLDAVVNEICDGLVERTDGRS